MTTRATVTGVGNEFRHDDGVGPAVIAELQRHAPADVELIVTDGDPTRLLEAWDGVELAIVIDAVRCAPAEPGRVHRTSIDGYLGSARDGSNHGLGLPTLCAWPRSWAAPRGAWSSTPSRPPTSTSAPASRRRSREPYRASSPPSWPTSEPRFSPRVVEIRAGKSTTAGEKRDQGAFA